jgi:hypothetical protein
MLWIPPLEESPGGLFIGVVRGLVIMSERPPNCPIYTEDKVIRALCHFTPITILYRPFT